MTRDEAKAILDGNRMLDDGGRYVAGFNDGLEDALDALSEAGAFTRERTPAEVLGYQTVRGEDGKPRLVRPEPKITKAQARDLWDRGVDVVERGPDRFFEIAWAEVTGTKP